MERVNEQSTAYLTVSFRDKAGTLATPTTISYRIDNIETGQEIRDDTAVTPAASSVEITLTPADNTLADPNRQYAHHRITVVATYGASDAVRAEYAYKVMNLQKVT